MAISATLTVKFDAPPEILALRDAIAERVEMLRKQMPDGVSLSGPDFHMWAKANNVCSAQLPAAEAQLVAAAKKLGLRAKGAPDVSFGVHGGFSGPVTLWYQISAE